MAQYLPKVGDTIYADPKNSQVIQGRGVKEGLATILNPTGIASATARAKQGYYRVQYHSDKSNHAWVHYKCLREPLPNDFQVDDIIRETTLGIYDLRIIEIHTVSLSGGNAPIEAEIIDDDGFSTGQKHYLEPKECILMQRGDKPFVEKGPEPKDNQGRYPRKRCYWCDGKLKAVPGFNYNPGSTYQEYHVCSKCGK